ncbi:nicotinamide-nucleotide amidase [Alteromonadaceae bacterium Bs31]|nr:nicotinamide-nucleotide amidase [Alteromonadaceae bacterium Bs31]
MKDKVNINALASSLGEALRARQWRVVTAESCTGGGVAQALTAVAGSSGWFELGLVTYSNQMKTRFLGVDEALLEKHGAVSEATVEAMLSGALQCSAANIGVAVSGIAGPSGSVPGKPVGTVCFAWGTRGNCCTSTQLFSGDREQVRTDAIGFALRSLLEFSKKTV